MPANRRKLKTLHRMLKIENKHLLVTRIFRYRYYRNNIIFSVTITAQVGISESRLTPAIGYPSRRVNRDA